MQEEIDLPAGVQPLDHTADVGLELRAADLPGVFRAAAQGLAWLLLDGAATGPREERKLHVSADQPAGLLREMLREMLWWHEVDGVTPVDLADVEVAANDGSRVLDARVTVAADPQPPVREIKGVTLHRLALEHEPDGWAGRVIFDV